MISYCNYDIIMMYDIISFDNIIVIYWISALFVTSGWKPALYFFDFRFYCSTSRSNSVVIIPFVQAACCTSRRTMRHTASRPKITKPCPSLSPQWRTDCSTPARASAPSNSPVPTLHLSRRRSSVSTLRSLNGNRPRVASDKGLLAAAGCLHRCHSSHSTVLQVHRQPDFCCLQ
jgi:hypothetical protein